MRESDHIDEDAGAPASALDLERLSKSFRQGEREAAALDGVSLRVLPCEFLSIVGSSGCGKSTLLRIVAGLETDYAGRAAVSGRPILGLGLDGGIIFQENRLFPSQARQEDFVL